MPLARPGRDRRSGGDALGLAARAALLDGVVVRTAVRQRSNGLDQVDPRRPVPAHAAAQPAAGRGKGEGSVRPPRSGEPRRSPGSSPAGRPHDRDAGRPVPVDGRVVQPRRRPRPAEHDARVPEGAEPPRAAASHAARHGARGRPALDRAAGHGPPRRTKGRSSTSTRSPGSTWAPARTSRAPFPPNLPLTSTPFGSGSSRPPCHPAEALPRRPAHVRSCARVVEPAPAVRGRAADPGRSCCSAPIEVVMAPRLHVGDGNGDG